MYEEDSAEESQLYDDTLVMLVENMTKHAKDARYSFSTSLINHFVLSIQLIKDMDPHIAMTLQKAVHLRTMDAMSKEQFSKVLDKLVHELSLAEQYAHGYRDPH